MTRVTNLGREPQALRSLPPCGAGQSHVARARREHSLPPLFKGRERAADADPPHAIALGSAGVFRLASPLLRGMARRSSAVRPVPAQIFQPAAGLPPTSSAATGDVMSDVTKSRRFGFHDVVDSEEMLVRLMRQFSEW